MFAKITRAVATSAGHTEVLLFNQYHLFIAREHEPEQKRSFCDVRKITRAVAP